MSAQLNDLRDFSKVRVEGAFLVDITRSDDYRVDVSADDAAHIKIERSGDTLRIGRRGMPWWFLHARPRVAVAMPALEELTLSGASQGKAAGFKSERDLSLRLNGASHLEVRDMSSGKLRIDVSGASNLVCGVPIVKEKDVVVSGASRIEVAGSAEKAKIELSGASQVKFANFALQDCRVMISGASSAQLRASGKLDLNLSGASRLEYAGSATMGDVRVSGASTLSHR